MKFHRQTRRIEKIMRSSASAAEHDHDENAYLLMTCNKMTILFSSSLSTNSSMIRGKQGKVYESIDRSISDDLLAFLQSALANNTPGDNMNLASDYFANKVRAAVRLFGESLVDSSMIQASPEELNTAVDD